VLRNAWSRLTHKQFLVLYPVTLGILNTLAFLAFYSVAGGTLGWDAFARTNANRWEYIHDQLGRLPSEIGLLLVALVLASVVCLLSAAVRAPYFRAIAGPGYPLAPQSVSEVARLGGFYAISYAIFYVAPYSFAAESTLGQALGFLLLFVALVFIYADYAVVFEQLDPIGAIRRSFTLLTRSWPVTVAVYLAAYLIWALMATVYDRYYQSAEAIFPLLPLSQLLLDALITMVLDVLLILLYGHLRRTSQ